MHQLLREQQAQVADGAATPPSRHEQVALAERVGDSTAEPSGLTYESIDAGGVPAQWATPYDAQIDGALLYFHGGGFCFCSAASHRKLVGHLAKAAGCRALNVDYRLATAYRWLLEQGTHPDRVVVAGDSAGGGIAAALLIKARDEGLPRPAAGVLLSPWVDLAVTGASVTTRAEVDFRQEVVGTKWCARLYLDGHEPLDPYASPLYADLAGLPPLYIQAGDWDILVDDSFRIADRARNAGVDVRLDVFPEMLHAFQLWAGNVPEADDAVALIGDYVRELRAA